MTKATRYRATGFSSLVCCLALLSSANAGAITRSDLVVLFGPDPDQPTSVTIDGNAVNSTIDQGKIVLQKNDPNCDPRTAPPCAYTLKRLAVTVTDFSYAGESITNGLFIDRGTQTILFDNGSGIVIPAGTPIAFAVTVRGSRAGGIGSVASDVTLDIDETAQTLRLGGAFSGSLEGYDVVASIAGRSDGPFVNVPPSIDVASTTQIVECTPLTLSATVSDRTAGDILTDPLWQIDGVDFGSGAGAVTGIAPGLHEVEGRVYDNSGALGLDSFLVNVLVDDVRPEFTFVPPDIVTSSCAAVDIGKATATDNCGQVDVSSDAPAHFFAGKTIVTWTARDARGNEQTAQQVVLAELRDDPSCCPQGSNVILGTPNNDTLNGTNGVDCILGLGGQDTIVGWGGNDVLGGGDGNDTIRGGDGNDLIWGGSGQDQLLGGNGDDRLAGDGGDDVLRSEAGNDELYGGQGQDQLFGGDGADSLFGDAGDDRLFGEAGDDVLDGGPDNDQCTGGNGFDTMLSCTAQDAIENPGPPAFPGDPSYEACNCQPSKCSDCSQLVAECDASSGCPQILQCVQETPGCNLPHECSAPCETGRLPDAVDTARALASCFGGCAPASTSPPPTGEQRPIQAGFVVTADWVSGYCVTLEVHNTQPLATSSWMLEIDIEAATVYTAWNGSFSASAGTAIVTPSFSWNTSIQPGTTNNSVGFCANRTVSGSGTLPSVQSATGVF